MAPALLTGIGAFSVSGLALVLTGSPWGTAPLAGFVLMCLAAPFLTGIGFFLPIIHRGVTTANGVALTFDDGPDPVTTPLLLDLLAKHNRTATFFVIGQRAEKHPDLVDRILAAGHSVGNHTQTHDPLIMLKSRNRLRNEIARAQTVLEAHSVRPRVFRPPAGITNPKLGPVLAELGLIAVNFSCRALDGGNRRINTMASRILGKVRAGDIVMLHDSCPPNGGNPAGYLAEVEAVIHGLSARNLDVIPLADLIEQPVMETL